MWPFTKRKTLDGHLGAIHKVKIHGIFFKLRRINPMDYVAGTKAVQMHYDTYKTKGQKDQIQKLNQNVEKVKEHYVDVFMAGVVEPKLCRKKDGEGIFVQNLFTDWDLANELYLKIMEITYGKKKFQSLISRQTGLQNLTS